MEDEATGALFDEMLVEAQGTLSLAIATEGSDAAGAPLTEREQTLVNAALAAGVLGALSVLVRQQQA